MTFATDAASPEYGPKPAAGHFSASGFAGVVMFAHSAGKPNRPDLDNKPTTRRYNAGTGPLAAEVGTPGRPRLIRKEEAEHGV
ncbi:hypothetical protein GALLR39Z86_41890 [Glycomyces algeriensis]|uniref:Uncharacterized protein n=1 Tax=Glycomyces algeriensis TaxID=256037 RepID=A0A9W6LIV6_9ACTN|nr:hypothetical protein GALLR39Z86_41890 [Glycomyces algeriensis]